MAAQELHRGRLIDHLQLVVRDLDASRRFYGAVLAFWPTERLMWSAGLGLGIHTPNYFSGSLTNPKFGGAASLRGGYALYADAKQALGLSLELTPAVYEFERLVGLALLVDWHRW